MPRASPLFTNTALLWTDSKKPSTPETGEQIWNTKRHEGLHRLGKILHSLCLFCTLSLSLCLSAFLALSQLPPPPSSPLSVVFRFLFSTGRRKEMKRAFAHLSE